MVTIRNMKQLISNCDNQLNRRARKLALRSLEAALNAVDPMQIINSKVVLKGSILKINGHSFDLREFKNIYVIGGGKASGSMAEALERILGTRITDGLVNVLRGTRNNTNIITLHEASHPVPDQGGVEGTKKMVDMVEGATGDDLIVCLVSGGGSSLMPLPKKGISLADKRQITGALLKSGATINEINTVRKHISDFKGGWLAKKAYPATILNLILSDVVGDPLDFIASGPTVPDSTTFSDALRILEKYDLLTRVPSSIKKILIDGTRGVIPETPKASDEAFKKVHNVVVGNNRSASQAAFSSLKSAGLNALLLTATLEGEARQVGIMLTSILREVSISGNPVKRPAGIVAGGETTVTVTGKGMGGRNQEIALSSATRLAGLRGVVVSSLSTDGVDGPTDAAGAIADGETLARAKESGLAPGSFLANNDSYHFFSELRDLIFTGPTGTNVNDVSVTIIL
jgi:glycerate 2-kinase